MILTILEFRNPFLKWSEGSDLFVRERERERDIVTDTWEREANGVTLRPGLVDHCKDRDIYKNLLKRSL